MNSLYSSSSTTSEEDNTSNNEHDIDIYSPSSFMMQAIADLNAESSVKKKEKAKKKQIQENSIASYMESCCSNEYRNSTQSQAQCAISSNDLQPTTEVETTNCLTPAAITNPMSSIDEHLLRRRRQLDVFNDLSSLQQQAVHGHRQQVEEIIRHNDNFSYYRRQMIANYKRQREQGGEEDRRASVPVSVQIHAGSPSQSNGTSNESTLTKSEIDPSKRQQENKVRKETQTNKKVLPLKKRITSKVSSDESGTIGGEKTLATEYSSDNDTISLQSASSDSVKKKVVCFRTSTDVFEIPGDERNTRTNERLSPSFIEAAAALHNYNQRLQSEAVAAEITQKQHFDGIVAAALLQKQQAEAALTKALLERQQQQNTTNILGMALSSLQQQSSTQTQQPLMLPTNQLSSLQQQPSTQTQQPLTLPTNNQSNKRRRLSSTLYDNCPFVDEKTQYYLEYGVPLSLPLLVICNGLSSFAVSCCWFIVIVHTIETMLTSFGPSTKNLRLSRFAFITPLWHFFADCFYMHTFINYIHVPQD